jgi:DNA invertase Pin-like site-specific DNA recombinase
MSHRHLPVIGYRRVSTDEQARDGFGMDAQEKKIRAYCELYELNLLRIISDPGLSGKDLERPGIQEVLSLLRQRKDAVQGLVVAKLDRLTRSLRDCSELIEEFFEEKRGKRLFSVEESIDTRRAAGRLVLNVIMTVAQWEREVIGERTKDAMQAKIAKGERCGKVRFGYDLAPDGIRLVENEQEQEAIAQMREWRTQGKTYRELVELVKGLGIETKEGGIVWQPTTIRRILLRPA